MCAQTSSDSHEQPREVTRTDIERLVKRFQAAVLSENDRCGDQEHAEAMRRAIFDQSELLIGRLLQCLSGK